ncbi:asparagine synthase-related protein [Rubrivirga marina]|uniref:asparagine synthase (glutamine-hydrolyzing) n=1 Tax=Rubrivirga marina TaxID=1196024 RepID=A0A271IXL4_9BACT|nr:asparagine synthase-related protein [Rubrivirga marina]PAP75860.1 hypothetical protein BSZ37_05090 [Rubrivirga marina]
MRPGDAPVVGPAADADVRLGDWRGVAGVHVLYADLDLADRARLGHALGLPATEPDAALLVAALRQWGADAPAHLGGAFAFAAWLGDRQAVVAARDPAGICPLVYADRGDRLVVGGDVREVLAAGVPDALDEDVMAAVFLTSQFRPSSVGRTCVRAIDLLPGGHRLTASERGTQVSAYWRIEDAPRLGLRRVEEIGEALAAVLREVTAEAVADPGTVGVHLSAGLDSSTVAAFAAHALAEAGRAPAAFSWQPAPGADGSPEHDRIAAVAECWGLDVSWCPAAEADFAAGLALDATREPHVMWAPEAPVRREARRRGVRLLLSGWGGDEAASFSGRGTIPGALLRQGQWRAVVAMIARDPVRALRRLRAQRTKRARLGLAPTLDDLRDAALRGEHATFARPDLLRRATLPEVEPMPADPHALLGWLMRRGHLGDRTGAWALAGLPFGVRYRYPLLDRRVLDLVGGLPAEAWLTRDGLRRWPLRAAGADLVPDAVRLHASKAEPHWLADSRRERTPALAALVPRLVPEVVGDRAEWVELDALRTALRDWLNAPGPIEPRGFHALAYLPLEDGFSPAPMS